MPHLKVKKTLILGLLSILFVVTSPARNNPYNLTDEDFKALALEVVSLYRDFDLYDPNASLIETLLDDSMYIQQFEGQSDLMNAYSESLTESYEGSTELTDLKLESYNQKRQTQAQEINQFLEDFSLTTGNPLTYINGWFYIPNRGWHFTNAQSFPFIFEPISKEWLLVVSKTEGLFSRMNLYELETLARNGGLQLHELSELTNEKATFLIAPQAQLLISANHNIYRSLSMLKSHPIVAGTYQIEHCRPLLPLEDCTHVVVQATFHYSPNRADLFFDDYSKLLIRTADPFIDYSLELSSRFKSKTGNFFAPNAIMTTEELISEKSYLIGLYYNHYQDETLLAEVQKILDGPHEYGFKYISESMPDLLEQSRELGLKEGAEILPDVLFDYPVVTAEELKEALGNDYTDCSYTEGWYYQPTKGWRWTSDKVFPFIYKNESQAWLYFNSETGDFYDYELGMWYTE